MSDLIERQDAIVTAVRAAIDWHKLANPQYSIAYCIGEAMRQLPSAEPTEQVRTYMSLADCVSRKAAINAINSWLEKAKHPMNRGAYNNGEVAAYSTAISEIENLPSAEPGQECMKCVFAPFKQFKEPKRRWVPVSEGLPEEEGWYLVTDDSGGVQWIEAVYCTPGDGLEPFWSVQNPIAWMPLPDPWKGE